MDYTPCNPIRVTQREQMKNGDVLLFSGGPGGEQLVVYVDEMPDELFSVVYEVGAYGLSKHHHIAVSYADHNIESSGAYPGAVWHVDIIGRMSPEAVDSMLADDCLDARF